MEEKRIKEREIYNAYILEASPLGTIKDDKFIRGGDALTIPPTEVKPASKASIKLIYENGFEPQEKFLFWEFYIDNLLGLEILLP